MITDQKIGELMRKIRKEKGYTSSEIADKLNISQPKFSRIETGSQSIPVTFLNQFCEACQISLVDFTYLLKDNGQIEHLTKIKENTSEYNTLSYSISELLTDLTLDERKAIIHLIHTFKNNEPLK
ncbi:helix-turn-helix domain-containing protein [Bacillus andreraoultii]|uniref:helix-turn-helix domain-containing protein n=1 Tax=Bacillus andreraoultii TaxID=1499685 RepID=UPI00053B1957|nr:helix-turn-helix transcriptional regulator [Bacillus andreraoultii]